MMAHASKLRHGGPRQGAGRKSAYGEPTKLVRIPESHVPVVTQYLDALKESKGAFAERSPVLRPVSSCRSTVTRVQALGRRVRTDEPTSGDDDIEGTVDLGGHLVRDPASTFVITVVGWSMRDAGIAEGDELVVDRDVAPDDGGIVVAQIDGELTVKRLRRLADCWLLQAASPESADVRAKSTDDLQLWGVVTRVLHQP